MSLKPINGIVVGAVLIGVAWLTGVSLGYWFGGGLVLFGLAIFATRGTNTAVLASQGKAWTAQLPDAKYSFAHGRFGIAVVPQSETIHLMEDGNTKSYEFKDVRSWNTKVQSGGNATYVGGNAFTAMGIGSDNRKTERDNERRTGLFVYVRDVDRPIWRVKFSEDLVEEERQQARWFEILNQTVNRT